MEAIQSHEAAGLLLDLGKALHAAAVPADEAEARLRGVARAYGIEAELFTLQSFLTAEIRAQGMSGVGIRRMPVDAHGNLTRAASLIELTDVIAAGKLDEASACRQLASILARRPRYPQWSVALAYSVYGGVVAARVRGGWREVGAGVAIGLVAGAVHHAASESDEVNLEKSFLGALFGSLAAIVLSFLLPPFDFGRAMFGGIVMLVPAVVVTIGIHELANGAIESGTIRLAYGLLRVALIAVGINAAFALAGFLGVRPAHVTATPLSHTLVLGLVALGGLALVPILQARRRDVIWMVAAAVLAFGTEELTKTAAGEHGAPVIAAFVLGVASYLQGRIPGHLAFAMLVPGLLQLAPGFLGTEATIGLLTESEGRTTSADSFFQVIVVAVQLGIGLLVAGLMFRRREPQQR